MNLLIVGIDGGTANIFDAFDMPFWKSLRRKDKLFDVTEDLNQRGWARMISGMGAEHTGALYMRPNVTAPGKFGISYGYKDLEKASSFVPIWQLAERKGFRVGVMNVPTTSPAQEVEGFCVSGGGGGIMQGTLPENAVFPRSIADELQRLNYIFDTRLGAQRFGSINYLTDKLEEMMKIRGRAFSELAKREAIDFGFVVFRAPTVLMYLAMSEIAHIMRVPDSQRSRASWSPSWLSLINKHMKCLDETLDRMFNELSPANHIVVSDHSIVPWTHNADFNTFLSLEGFATRKRSVLNLVKNSGKSIVRSRFRKQMQNASLGNLGSALMFTGAPLESGARAFSGNYVYGMYINDHDRFGGPVGASEIDEEVDHIVDAFNWRALRDGVDMTAVPYRRHFDADARFCQTLPDVTILQSGHAFPSTTVGSWYAPNPKFAPVTDIKGVGGMHTGQKGTRPILMANQELAAFHDPNSPADLRSVYKLTEKLFCSIGL